MIVATHPETVIIADALLSCSTGTKPEDEL
jgi:hypothetical protein